jgi:choline transport protein
MSEELYDAAYTLPRIMVYSTFANGTMALAMLIAYCYCIGDILEGPTSLADT